MLEELGPRKLNEQEYRQSIRVMKEVDKIIERVLFLEGLPNLQKLGVLNIGENVPECLGSDLGYEVEVARPNLQAGIVLAERLRTTMLLAISSRVCSVLVRLQSIGMKTQQTLMNEIGLENYLQSQIHD